MALRNAAESVARTILHKVRGSSRSGSTIELIDAAYRMILRRPPDAEGRTHYKDQLDSGSITKDQFLDRLIASDEFRLNILQPDMGISIHESRKSYVKGLPKASRILDLGGTSLGSNMGALYHLGYPYEVKEIVIVDLPQELRHELYRETKLHDRVETPIGPVRYVYVSMADFSQFASESFDMVFSGQSIEHITEADGDLVMQGAMRVLTPGGYFCLDTPNGRATRLQQSAFIDPDHKVEYTHQQLSKKIVSHGFKILEAKGMNLLNKSFSEGKFSAKEVTQKQGVFNDIENCYILSYICQK